MSPKKQSSKQNFVYQEFGQPNNPAAVEKAVPDLPPAQQNLRVEKSKSGRKGKTVTIIKGFEHNSENLSKLLKQLKKTCGSGGTVKENTLEIQGDHRIKLVEILSKLGYKVKISGG